MFPELQTPAAYFATAPRGIETVTARELTRLGATEVRTVIGGVHFLAPKKLLYRACLELRTAHRILFPLREFAAQNPEMLYSQSRRVKWESLLNPEKTFAVYATLERGRTAPPTGRRGKPGTPPHVAAKQQNGITHTQYAALKVKDAIVDRLRQEQGARPNVDTQNPDFRLHAHFAAGRCTLSLDASGGSLHERGYRLETTEAPLRETLAASILELLDWDGATPLYDPLCGSGTLVIEAAMRARNIPPGLLRPQFGLHRWPDFDQRLWDEVVQEARSRILPKSPVGLFGSDSDPKAIAAAQANAARAGVTEDIQWFVRGAEQAIVPRDLSGQTGLLLSNPPYGARLGDEADLKTLYRTFSSVWPLRFPGWKLALLVGNLNLAREIELPAALKIKLDNGPLECRLLQFQL